MSQKALTTPDPMEAMIKGDKASTVCTDAECLGLFIDVLRRQGKVRFGSSTRPTRVQANMNYAYLSD